MILRDYQQAAIDALYQWFEHHDGNPLVVVPTGGGKSIIMAGFIRSVLEQWPTERILVVTHVRELIEQNHRTMLRYWPKAPAGIYSAGLGFREHASQVLFCGVQSVHDKAKLLGWADLILIDEAHRIPKGDYGQYRRLIGDLASMNPKLKLVGLTATPFRTGAGRLDEGDDRMFHGIAYDLDVKTLIDRQHLANVVTRDAKNKIDLTGVRTRAGEFVDGDLQNAVANDAHICAAVAETVQRGQDRKAWLVFCCGVEHAEDVTSAMRAHGIDVEMVTGTTPDDERDRIVGRFRDGDLRCLVNVSVLTTGFDAPRTDLIAMMRPTKSPVLYVQMVGRGMRTFPGKQDCLLLDFGGNARRHGLIDAPMGRDDEGKDNAKPCPECDRLLAPSAIRCTDEACGYVWTKKCRNPDCGAAVLVTAKECPDCGTLFQGEPRKANDPKPDENAQVIGFQPIARWDVAHVSYRPHQKEGKPMSLCVEYHGHGFSERVREWVCFEHPEGSFPRRKAAQWWRARGGQDPVPETVDLARVRIECGEIRNPSGVTVDVRGQWPELRGIRFEREPGSDDTFDPAAPQSASDVDHSHIPF